MNEIIPAEKDLSPEEVYAFAESNKYRVEEGNFLYSCCVDGRAKEGEGKLTPLARAGADAGDLMITIAALRRLAKEEGVSVDSKLRADVMDMIVEFRGGAEHFRFHTDEHAGYAKDENSEKNVAAGCGHLSQAGKNPSAYGLTAEDMTAVFEKLAQLKNAGAREEVLTGSHGERAVLVVKSEDFGLRHRDSGYQVFVYQRTLHLKQLARLAESLAVRLEFQRRDITRQELFDVLTQVSDLQLGQTIRHIARGKPVYEVAISRTGKVAVTLLESESQTEDRKLAAV